LNTRSRDFSPRHPPARGITRTVANRRQPAQAVSISYMDLSNTKIAVLGTGQMGGALVRGWAKAEGLLTPANIRLYDVRAEAARTLATETGATACAEAADAVQGADVVLLAVKPYLIAERLRTLGSALPVGSLIVSVAAGISLKTLEQAIGFETPVIRVMPNTPALVGEGASAFCRGTHAREEHAALVDSLFSAVGRCVEVTEAQIDAVVGVSGSGPAYFYLLIEALTDGGVRAGLPRDVARTLAAQTALGAAKMVLETGQHPAALKDAVTTPGGTTIAALGVLEAGGVRAALMDAVRAAAERSKELG